MSEDKGLAVSRSCRYRLVVTAGDRIKKITFEGFEQRFGRLVKLYGSTELGAIATSKPDDTLKSRSDGVIQPMPGLDMRLKEDGRNAEVAEIVCRHDSDFETYVDKQGRKLNLPAKVPPPKTWVR